MKNDDASEEEPEELFPDSGKTVSSGNRESRKEREDKLKMMMEDDDNDEKANDANDNGTQCPMSTSSASALINYLQTKKCPMLQNPKRSQRSLKRNQ